jgi:glycosyltransferase involved in cell wall biosynthesis
MNPKLSVIIRTLNRAESLKHTIQSLLIQNFPSNSYEIIVVDNGSTDHTQSVVKKFQQVGNAPLLYVYEAELGISAASNRGILSTIPSGQTWPFDGLFLRKPAILTHCLVEKELLLFSLVKRPTFFYASNGQGESFTITHLPLCITPSNLKDYDRPGFIIKLTG